MNIINKIFSQSKLRNKLSESANIERSIVILYIICEQYPSRSVDEILTEYDKQLKFDASFNATYKLVKNDITRLYEESLAPTNISAGIDSSTPRITPNNKETKDVVRRTKKDKTQVQ